MNNTQYDFEDLRSRVDGYPMHIQDILYDLMENEDLISEDYSNFNIFELDNIMTGFTSCDNQFKKFILESYREMLVEDDSIYVVCAYDNGNSGITIEQQIELLSFLGFVDCNVRFGLQNRVPMVYIGNTAGACYHKIARYIVLNFYKEFGKIGGPDAEEV